MPQSLRQTMPQLAVRIQTPIRFRTEGLEEHTSPVRRRTKVLEGIRQCMGIPLPRAIICRLFLCRDRSRDYIQLNAPNKQTRSLSTILPEHNQGRDPALSRHNGAPPRDVPRVYGRTETHRHTPDETGLHLPISTPLRTQVRILAAPLTLCQTRSCARADRARFRVRI